MVNEIAVSNHIHSTSLGIVVDEDGENCIKPYQKMRVVRLESLLRTNKEGLQRTILS